MLREPQHGRNFPSYFKSLFVRAEPIEGIRQSFLATSWVFILLPLSFILSSDAH
jgi:hypothetical protein